MSFSFPFLGRVGWKHFVLVALGTISSSIALLRAESEYPLTRVGIEGFVANGSLTLTLECSGGRGDTGAANVDE